IYAEPREPRIDDLDGALQLCERALRLAQLAVDEREHVGRDVARHAEPRDLFEYLPRIVFAAGVRIQRGEEAEPVGASPEQPDGLLARLDGLVVAAELCECEAQQQVAEAVVGHLLLS